MPVTTMDDPISEEYQIPEDLANNGNENVVHDLQQAEVDNDQQETDNETGYAADVEDNLDDEEVENFPSLPLTATDLGGNLDDEEAENFPNHVFEWELEDDTADENHHHGEDGNDETDEDAEGFAFMQNVEIVELSPGIGQEL